MLRVKPKRDNLERWRVELVGTFSLSAFHPCTQTTPCPYICKLSVINGRALGSEDDL